MNKTEANTDTAATRWQREVKEKISRKIRSLQNEFDQIVLLKQLADEVRNFRKSLLAERFD